MKKFVAFILCIVMVLGLVGCAQTNETPATEEKAPVASNEPASSSGEDASAAPEDTDKPAKVWERTANDSAVDSVAVKRVIENSPVYQAVQSGLKGPELLAKHGLQEKVAAGRMPGPVEGDAKGVTIAVLIGNPDQMFTRLLLAGLQDAIRDGDTLLVYNYDYDSEVALGQVEAACARGVDAIVAQPQDQDAAVAWANAAADSSVPFFTIDQIISDTTNVAGMLGGDDYGIGYYSGIQVAEKYYEKYGNYDATIMTYCMQSVVANVVRQRGFEDALAEYGMGVTTNVEAMWTTEDALAPIEAAYTANPVYDVFWSPSDPPAIAAVRVFEELGVLDSVMVFCHEVSYWVSQQMEAGVVYGASDASPYYYGYNGIKMAYDYLDGKVTEQVRSYNPLIPVYPEDYTEYANTYIIEEEISKDWSFSFAS